MKIKTMMTLGILTSFTLQQIPMAKAEDGLLQRIQAAGSCNDLELALNDVLVIKNAMKKIDIAIAAQSKIVVDKNVDTGASLVLTMFIGAALLFTYMATIETHFANSTAKNLKVRETLFRISNTKNIDEARKIYFNLVTIPVIGGLIKTTYSFYPWHTEANKLSPIVEKKKLIQNRLAEIDEALKDKIFQLKGCQNVDNWLKSNPLHIERVQNHSNRGSSIGEAIIISKMASDFIYKK